MSKKKSKKSGKPRKGSTARRVADTEALPPPSPLSSPPSSSDPSAVELYGDADDAGGWDEEGLTVKQRMFVAALVGPAAGNATRAAQLAGFADDNYNTLKQRASEVRRLPNVQRAVQRALVAKQGGAEWTRAGVVEIANATIREMLSRDENGKFTIDPEAVDRAAAWGVVKKFEMDRVETPDGGFVSVKYKLELHSRLEALKTLAKMHGMLVEQQQVTVRQVDPHQQAMGRLLKDPKAFALARQLANRMKEATTEGNDDRGGDVDRN